MHDTIILLNDLGFIRQNLDQIKKIARENKCPVIPLSDAVLLYLRNKGLHCIDYHQFEYKDIYRDVYSTAREWGCNWHCPNGKSIAEVGSYSLGSIIEWSMIYFLSNLLRLFISISTIIENVKPKKIILLTTKDNSSFHDETSLASADIGLLPYIVEECLKYINFSVEVISMKLVCYTQDNRIRDYKLVVYPLFHYLNHVFSGICRLYNIILGKRKRILFFDGFRHFCGIMESSKHKNYEMVHLQRKIGPSILWKLYSNGIRVVTLPKKKTRLEFVKIPKFDLDNINDELSDFFVYRRKNLLPCIWPRLEFLLKEYFPKTVCPDLDSVIRAVKEILPSCIVTENDTTYKEKMLVVVAKEFNISTVVIQHGVANYYKDSGEVVHGMYPLTADIFFAFGKTCKDWFVHMDVVPNRIVITGAARFDSYYNNMKMVNGSSKRKKTVLIILQDNWFREGVVNTHIGLCEYYNYISKFIALAGRNPGLQFIVRPHNSNHLWTEIFRKELDSLDNLTISCKDRLEDVFKRVDLSIGYNSTALLESLVHRIPVITSGMGEYKSYSLLWKYGLAKKASTFEELEMELKKLVYDTQERDKAVKTIERNLHLFNYGDDGMASQRIAEELNKIAKH